MGHTNKSPPRIKWAHIDSLNLSSSNLEDLFKSEDFVLETVKGVGVFNPKRWRIAYGKPLTRNITEAKILHTRSGLELPIKRHSRSNKKQTLEIAGLHGYNEKSIYLKSLLESIKSEIQGFTIMRLDVAIDFKGKVPKKVIRELEKARTPFKYMETTYSKTAKEKKSNQILDIKIYDKAKKENLNYELERLEFCFKGSYFGSKYKVKDLLEVYTKMKKTIKRFTGLEIGIKNI